MLPRRRNPLAAIADKLFAHKAPRRRKPVRTRRSVFEQMEDRYMLATVVGGQALNDDPDFFTVGDDLLTGEKIVAAGGLVFNSSTLPRPIIALDAQLDSGVSVSTLTSFDVELRLLYPGNSSLDAVATKNYPATGLSSQQNLRFALQVDASSFSTNNYSWRQDHGDH